MSDLPGSDLNELLAPDEGDGGRRSGMWRNLALTCKGVEGRWPGVVSPAKSWYVHVVAVAENMNGNAFALLWISGVSSLHKTNLPSGNGTSQAIVEALVSLPNSDLEDGPDGGLILVPASEVILNSGDMLHDLLRKDDSFREVSEGGE